MQAPSAEELVAAVQQSPALVALHDRARWCDLYSREAQVNDPVGSRPHRGRAAIERFYDTFIAPNTIIFHLEHDIVCGMSVMRDLTVETRMSTCVRLSVPMHLRYDLIEEDGRLEIRALYAHWELSTMIGQLLRTGLKGLWTSVKLGPQLIINQGIGGMIGFMRGLFGSGRGGKRSVGAFLAAAQRGDVEAAGASLHEDCALENPAHRPVSLQELAAALRTVRWSKVLASGNSVTATIVIAGRRGVALFRFDRGPRRITGVHIYV